MLNINVEMDLNEHISVIGSKILEIAKDKRITFESLMLKFLKDNERYTPDQFIKSTMLLFSIGILSIENQKVVLKNV